jgi:hypothetical protein
VFAQEPQVARNTTFPVIACETRRKRGTRWKTAPVAGFKRRNLSRVGVQATTRYLDADDAIRKALEGNNSIEISRDDVRFQETRLRSLLGVYDPVFTAIPTFTKNHTTGQAATRDFRVNADVTQFIQRGGGSYRVFFNNTRTENAFSQAQVSSGFTGSE